MPALPSSVSSFIDSLIDKLTEGPSIGQNAVAGPANGLSALDAATALELLQEACSSSTPLTALAGSSASQIVDGAATFVAGRMVGNYAVIVTGDPANVGEARRIISNTTTTLVFDEPFPAAVANGDTYQIVAGAIDEVIEALRQGKEAGRAVNRLTGETRLFVDGIATLLQQTGATPRERVVMSTTFVAGSTTSVCNVNNRGSEFALNGLVGLKLTNSTSGESRPIVANTESSISVDPPFASAPSAGNTAVVSIPDFSASSPLVIARPMIGGQQENANHADLLSQAKAAVVAYTPPA